MHQIPGAIVVLSGYFRFQQVRESMAVDIDEFRVIAVEKGRNAVAIPDAFGMRAVVCAPAGRIRKTRSAPIADENRLDAVLGPIMGTALVWVAVVATSGAEQH